MLKAQKGTCREPSITLNVALLWWPIVKFCSANDLSKIRYYRRFLLRWNFFGVEVTIEHWHQQGAAVAAGVVGGSLEQVASRPKRTRTMGLVGHLDRYLISEDEVSFAAIQARKFFAGPGIKWNWVRNPALTTLKEQVKMADLMLFY